MINCAIFFVWKTGVNRFKTFKIYFFRNFSGKTQWSVFIMEMNSYELFKEIRLGDEHIKLFFIPNLVIFLFFIDCGNGLFEKYQYYYANKMVKLWSSKFSVFFSCRFQFNLLFISWSWINRLLVFSIKNCEKENYAGLERENDLFSDNQDRPFYLQGICGRELTFKFWGIVAEFC